MLDSIIFLLYQMVNFKKKKNPASGLTQVPYNDTQKRIEPHASKEYLGDS